jgi:uncharacterized membrane protein
MACACRKSQEKQDKIIELNRRIAATQDQTNRDSLIAEREIIENSDDDDQNKVVKFIKRFLFLVIIKIPFIIIMTVLVIIVLFLRMIISAVAKGIFNKEIGGIKSPLETYEKLKNSAVASAARNMREKIGNITNARE